MVRIVGGCLLLVAAAVLLSSCGWAVRPAKEFAGASRDFAQRLRWKDFNGASRHLAEEHRTDFLERLGALEDLHIVDVRLESIDHHEEGKRAETRTVVEYYLLPSATVKKLRLNQEWSYEGGDRYRPGIWQITTPFPPFP